MKTIIIGGGLGGLAAATTLAAHGVETVLFEKNDHFGGKMKRVDIDGYHFDFGPNTITMPYVFEDILRMGGMDNKLNYRPLEVHTRNQFPDGTVFDLSSNRDYMIQQLSAFDSKGAKTYDRFLQDITRLFHTSYASFLSRAFTSRKDYLSPSLLKETMKVRPLMSMDRFFSRYFSSPYVQTALNRYATYVGSDPYRAPATFAMIAYLELMEGVYYVEGGNTQIAETMTVAARNAGASLHSDTEVKSLLKEKDHIRGVVLDNGEHIEADNVIVNGDVGQALPALLGEKQPKYDPSISAFVILAGLDGSLPLHHHHLLFSGDYKKEFTDLQSGRYPEDPTIYISTSRKSDPDVSPDGDNCFLLVNAPPGKEVDAERYKQLIYDKLRNNGIPIASYVKTERIWTPKDIEKQFSSFRGALYGPSVNNKKQAFLRPRNKSDRFHNLYFAGGSTHPGGGSPIVTLSGRNVANHILGKLT
ncbi:phytoene desaturase family protein [Salimicrobium halophilum]|uniref:4,4'-diaponeurosporene oxygenase n=1 Tax=Salimicrobium halophilum TaxID=86666 RepID=A0A1G8RNH0_9BACI|nr:phytoene desaturase family protein [Salimicrobium halophilum]SDJ18496.1 phytoene desaturase [Salimicrobium halophilum]